MARPASVSMLGKLFSLGSAAPPAHQDPRQSFTSKPVSSLESVTEDIHTRSLLFPDANALFQHRNDQMFPLSAAPALPPSVTLNPFDYTGDVDLELRDVRVLVMQDTLASVSASLLFDSHPGPVAPSPVDRTSSPFQDARRTPTSPRKSSLGQTSRPVVIQPESPQLRQGAFDRRGSMHSRSQNFVAETDVQRAAREYREELSTFASCIFGSSELLSYKGTSTKVHVVPTEARHPDHAIFDGKGSMGRSSLRSSRLGQSVSSELFSPTQAPAPFMTSQASVRHADRRKVLITRLFPVTLPAEDDLAHARDADDAGGFPFPQPEDAGSKKKKPQPKQKRTPMYAVVLVIQLPPPAAARTPCRFPGGSFTDQDSFPSSFNSARRSGWTMVGSGAFNDSSDSVFPFDGDDQMEFITQHWDIIMRTLTHLQSVSATTISVLLQQADLAAPDPQPVSHYVARTPSVPTRRGEEHTLPKPPKTNSKIVMLPQNALAHDVRIMHEIEAARSRIVTGLKAVRVVTGQGRWGIWRDEARHITKGVSANNEPFFFNLLTGFLSVHIDWLQALCPASYRKRYIQLQKAKPDEDMSVTARTVIVSDDKMAARRLIFLLSAFLPAQQHFPTLRAHRPSTSASYGALSQSPPSVIVPIGREESLRRKMTRRTGAPRRASHSRTVSQSTRTSIPANLAHLSIEPHHERRGSDAASIRTANLAIPTDYVARKSSIATTATIAADTTVPHFSTFHRTDTGLSTRPGSSGSIATDDLRRTLTRGESAGQASIGGGGGGDSRQGSRWGSVISFWSGARRRDSATSAIGESPGLRPTSNWHSNEPLSPTKPGLRRPDKLADMVREVELERRDDVGERGQEDPETPRGVQDPAGDAPELAAKPRRWLDSPAFDSPVKTSINAEDGIIDVDVPFPDYLTSFDTAVSSPSSSGYLSTPGLGTGVDSFEQASRIAIDGDLPLNSAGWLQAYHPDFALQAVPPQPNLTERIKASLQAEPTPVTVPLSPGQPQGPRWVDISSAIIADLTTGIVKKISYRRRILPKPGVDRAGHNAPLLTPSILPYESQLDEEFVVDDIVSAESKLVDAVQRVIALRIGGGGGTVGDEQGVGAAKTGGSSDSSRSNSKAPGGPARSLSQSPPHATEAADPPPPHTTRHAAIPEVHRNECKTVVLTALSELIRDVIEHRSGQDHTRERDTAIRAAVRHWVETLEAGGAE